jgi:hypothetical protein
MDFAAVTSMLYPELNAAGAADLAFWTADELTRYADLQLAKLSGDLMLFVDAQDLVGIAGQSAYNLAQTTDDVPLDTRFVSLIHTIWGAASIAPANVMETEARDANWGTATATAPTSWIGDWLGTGLMVVYPQPTQDAAFTVFCQRTAPELSTDATAILAPSALGDLLHLRVLAEARSKRSDAWMPEAAALAGQLGEVIEQAFRSYFGAAM